MGSSRSQNASSFLGTVLDKGKKMILQIYGVKILNDGEKERRYYGYTEEKEADDALHSVISTGCDYAYAKQIGMGDAVKYLSNQCHYVETTSQRQDQETEHQSLKQPGGRFHASAQDQKQPS